MARIANVDNKPTSKRQSEAAEKIKVATRKQD